ncbi:hypothetical protein PF005_g9935 [Phytophthora fragariae]|uniref:Uncharacterized protein n=1 Tax=Phytophthora fragariae TaxID=53985 RepID=A0A6A3EUQ8_9STRA|nr:hypothetical protein PF003_g29583 [Phytophthora fragariae]KAE8937232.1 hypothetical protein PF009_g12870 [Phytophthora fragariae]KAE9012677.1 hypothetical protein PF011_g8812 [Phytophthora fragariae]KAE9115658.1 hypothetical protein PF007_g9941 [Phytophthora fragariae]KAE9119993.1 hypothetical protein PF010_g7665 [Phytophthora fragariae]
MMPSTVLYSGALSFWSPTSGQNPFRCHALSNAAREGLYVQVHRHGQCGPAGRANATAARIARSLCGLLLLATTQADPVQTSFRRDPIHWITASTICR